MQLTSIVASSLHSRLDGEVQRKWGFIRLDGLNEYADHPVSFNPLGVKELIEKVAKAADVTNERLN
jgi:hypothetical protein